jgi:serine phosphatase RsbU (regulator of sigma subunit)/anti-sigma regulatory factor (Ser/Thr protein kinase)
MEQPESDSNNASKQACINNSPAREITDAKKMHARKVKPLPAFAICFVIYLAVAEISLAIPQFNNIIQIRPSAIIGPTLGIFFGLPGIFACALANVIANTITFSYSPLLLTCYFLAEIIYSGLPRWVWYFIYRNSDNPYPRFESARKTILYVALTLIDSLIVIASSLYFLSTASEDANITTLTLLLLNSAWMLLYAGIPLLYALERSPLSPTPPFWIKVPYQQMEKTNLTQRFVVAFTLVAAVLGLFISVISILITGDEHDLSHIVEILYIEMGLLAIPVFIPMFIFLHYIEGRFVLPIEVLANDQKTFIQRVENDAMQGHFDLAEPVNEHGTKPKYEVAELFDSTNKMRADLSKFVDRIRSFTAQKQRYAAELDIAAQIQTGVVPKDFEAFTEGLPLDISGYMRPAREVGGDFYDVFGVNECEIAFVIGDVSGKGVPAALFMMRAQSLLRQCITQANDLGSAFSQANDQLCDRNDAVLFVTAFACVFNAETGAMRYVNAGHNSPIHMRGKKAEPLKGKRGLVLGAMSGMHYREENIYINPGELVLLYTDGVTESANVNDELFGEDRMLETLRESMAQSQNVEQTIEALVKRIDGFASGAPQADDITAVAFSWKLPVQGISIPPDRKYLDDLFAFLEPLCKTKGCTPKMKAQLMLACEELFVNVCNYGFPKGTSPQPVEIAAAVDAKLGCLHITFRDKGIAYNPLQHESKIVDPADEERKGGLGLLLVRKYVEDIRYTRSDETNVLRITKHFV